MNILPDLTPTPLLELSPLAKAANVARVFVKDEGKRPLGNFKYLGGMRAGLHVLSKASGDLPRLICASDGNHGLAVTAAAHSAGGRARIYLPETASRRRAARIEALGGQICWVAGTYDDAVDAAVSAAERGEGVLVADTAADPAEEIVGEVMAGYGQMCSELAGQLREKPTHLFVQAGVGGLAAALAEGLADKMSSPERIVVVEPQAAACVAAALEAKRPVQIAGDLHTSAEMLSCGLASAAALEILLRHRAYSLLVSESSLGKSVDALRSAGGPLSTPSGCAGLAGLLTAASDPVLRSTLELTGSSRVLLVVTEAALDEQF